MPAEDRVIRVDYSPADVDRPITVTLAGRGKPATLNMTREEAWVVSDALRSSLGRIDPNEDMPRDHAAACAALREARDTITHLHKIIAEREARIAKNGAAHSRGFA